MGLTRCDKTEVFLHLLLYKMNVELMEVVTVLTLLTYVNQIDPTRIFLHWSWMGIMPYLMLAYNTGWKNFKKIKKLTKFKENANCLALRTTSKVPCQPNPGCKKNKPRNIHRH